MLVGWWGGVYWAETVLLKSFYPQFILVNKAVDFQGKSAGNK